MNVSLTEELEELVQKKVESGRYTSASEVVRAGLRLLEQEDELRATRLEAVRAQVREGIDQAKRGELIDGEAAVGRVTERAAAKRRNAGG
jgi:antitoxin ParD1/3/4